MKEAQKIMEKKSVIKAEMDKILPKEQSDVLWAMATEKLKETLIRYESLPKGVHMHTDSRIFPSASIYLTLKEVIGEEKAYKVIEDAAIEGCRDLSEKLGKIVSLPGMNSLFIGMWDPMCRKIFGPDNGFANVFYPKKKGEYRMDVTSCPYHKYLTELGCPEINRIFCENDDRIYGNLPGLKFERTGTIGKGADRCDFCMRLE